MKKVLFVCLGNICRSPSAEGVMQTLADRSGRAADFEFDSAGTYGGHAGDRADERMRAHASRRGYELLSRSRQVKVSDFEEFDLILAMDASNQHNLLKICPAEFQGKIEMMTDYCTKFDDKEVPDPYYGGEAGFEHVLDLLEDACENLLKKY